MQEIQIPEEVNTILHRWARWQRDDSFGRGYPNRSSGFTTGGDSSPDAFDHLCESADNALAKAVDVLVDSLDVRERDALYHHFTGSLPRYPGDPIERVNQAARHFHVLAKEKGIT